MPHRSNQAVASQEPAAPQPPQEPPPRRRLLIGWTTALTALAVSTALLGGGVWLVRLSVAEFLIGAALAERGVVADFQVTELDFDHAAIRGVRIGSASAPDAAIGAIDASWRWRGLIPRLTALRIREPRVRVRVDGAGRMSAGALNQMRGRPSARRMTLPALRLDIENGEAVIDAPFGALTAAFHADGVLGEDFSGTAHIAETTLTQGDYALEAGSAELAIISRESALAFRLIARLRALQWADQRAELATLRVMGRAPLDLSRYDAEAALRVFSIDAPRFSARTINAAIGGESVAREDGLAPAIWQTRGRVWASELTLASNRFEQLRFDAHGEGRDDSGSADWTLAAQRFEGLALTSERPSASGGLTLQFGAAMQVNADARLLLARARLDRAARQRIRNAFPDLPEAPIGPTFAQAESALDRAADRFSLILPLTFRSQGDNAHIVVNAPVEARAESGAVLRMTPLRQDAPAFDVQWPELLVQGAVAIELAGGGAPATSLLLDRLAWSPSAPFETEGTLSLSSWRAQGASIAAEELSVSLAIAPNGDGRAEIRGPAHITGPLGQGEMRDLTADLDLAIAWDEGWRVTPNQGCLPMRMGGLDAAGLSFADGRFALCPHGEAFIAADARERLSGGFAIESLVLNGRLAGPGAQPARIGTARITGVFGGVTDDARLALRADSPTLRVDMGESRPLELVMHRLTAEARIADSWRVDGVFEQGGLTDPSLPGSLSAIAGRWSAAPEDGQAVIRVAAAEALLTANRPTGDDERPMFNPIRLRDIDALLRGGDITADGAIVLEESAQQIAQFTARHDTDEGVGAAHIQAPDIVFDAELQPHHISELARGMVADVRGPAAGNATISWTRADIAANGRVLLQGVSLATATMPIIQNVRGEVSFDDLFALTTPPGQELTIGLVNPGVSVRDGAIRFQLLPDESVRIEQAEFAFASGVLAMTPTTIALGEDETRIELTLRDVDVSRLIAELNLPDLAATGRLEGSFPLRLTRRSAFVENGRLNAAPEGGIISYTGQAGESATGAARIAFDALRGFRYDRLSLTLDGDLSGEVVSSINFSGENTGRPVDLGPIAPGLGDVQVRGVPFVFNVAVTAPFRRLAETAATIVNPGAILDQTGSRREEPEPSAPVDPAPPGS